MEPVTVVKSSGMSRLPNGPTDSGPAWRITTTLDPIETLPDRPAAGLVDAVTVTSVGADVRLTHGALVAACHEHPPPTRSVADPPEMGKETSSWLIVNEHGMNVRQVQPLDGSSAAVDGADRESKYTGIADGARQSRAGKTGSTSSDRPGGRPPLTTENCTGAVPSAT